MSYDKKLLAARAELERERTAHTEELEARRRDIYYTRAAYPRNRPRAEHHSSVRSAGRNGVRRRPDCCNREAARPQSLGLQEERGNLLRQLGLPADYLTDKAAVPKMRRHRLRRQCDLRVRQGRYAKLLKEQLSSVLPIADQNFSKFDMSFLLHPPGWPQWYFAARKYGI